MGCPLVRTVSSPTVGALPHPDDATTRHPTCHPHLLRHLGQSDQVDGQRNDLPDLSGLQPRYTWSTGRGLRVVLLVVTSFQAVLAVSRLLQHADTVDVVLSLIMLASFAVFLGAYFVWTPATILAAEGVRLQNGFPKARFIAWQHVQEVQVQGRWQDVSTLLRTDGRRERLVGMPVEDAQRLADALAARATI